MKYQEIIEGFEERLKNIAVFGPLFDLQNKTKYDYSLVELGLAVLLYILEDMLLGNKDCTYRNLAYFLQDLIADHYQDQLDFEEALELTHYLVRDALMNQGKPHSFEYLDYEQGQLQQYKFHLIELEDYKIEDKVVRLKLSPIGLELLFKTKEMYNELQVSISQLYLRQQIQKGVFDGALRSVEELALAVRNEKNKIKKLEEHIIRNVLQVAREKELEKQMERINQQLERERKIFDELQELIEYTLDEYHSEHLGKKEEEAVDKILKIRRRLHEIVSDHESLFTDKIRIQQLMNNSIETMIINAFNTRVNFETEFVRPIVKKEIKLDILKKILDPIFPMKTESFFHPGRIFLEQPLSRKKHVDEELLWKLEEEKIRQQEEEERKKKIERERRFEKYLLMILTPLTSTDKIKLSNILDSLEKKNETDFKKMINQIDFYPFLMQLHQMGVIPLLTREETQSSVLDELPRVLIKVAEENKMIYELEGFELIATDDIVRLPNGYVISDFIIERRTNHGMG